MTTGYERHPLLRMTPTDGVEEILDLIAEFADPAGGSALLAIVEGYRPDVTRRDNVNRKLRPIYRGVRAQVQMLFEVTTMELHARLVDIVTRATGGHWTLGLSIDGGDSEYEVTFLDYEGPKPIRGRTVCGAAFSLRFESTDLLDEPPAVITGSTTPQPLNPLLQALASLPSASLYPRRIFVYAPPGGAEQAVISLGDGLGGYSWQGFGIGA